MVITRFCCNVNGYIKNNFIYWNGGSENIKAAILGLSTENGFIISVRLAHTVILFRNRIFRVIQAHFRLELLVGLGISVAEKRSQILLVIAVNVLHTLPNLFIEIDVTPLADNTLYILAKIRVE